MSTLISGGAGYIGSHTVKLLLEKKQPIIVLDNLCNGKLETLPTDVPFYKGNIQDSELVSRICRTHQVDSVIHFAAYLKVPESVKYPLKYYQNNVSASLKFIQTIYNEGVKHFVFSSSCAVYGNCQTPVSEQSPIAPKSSYGNSKWMIEQILQDLSISSKLNNDSPPFNTISLRYFNGAGASIDNKLGPIKNEYSLLIDIICQAAKQNSPINIYGTNLPTKDGSCIRDFVHVDDLAQAHFLALKSIKEENNSYTLNCGSGRSYSVKEAIKMIEKISGKKITIIEKPQRLGDPIITTSNIDRIKNILGWSPKNSTLETICQSAWSWHNKK